MFRKMPFILLAVILLAGFLEKWIPIPTQSILYGISLSLKSIIIFLLPFLIFGLLFKTAVQLASQASKMIILILVAICVSNFVSTFISYGGGIFASHLDLSMQNHNEINELHPAWEFSIPALFGNAKAMFAGLILGVIMGWWKPKTSKIISSKLEKIIALLLKVILYMIPLFIFGFVIKLHHDRTMSYILRNYSLIFALIAGLVFAYILFIYLAVNRFNLKMFITSIKNMLPAAISGFGSMSSAASMPLTILGTEKNVPHSDFARAIIPATVNIHLIGDCFAIPIFALAIMNSYGFLEPSFYTYLVFAASFVLAKFSVAAVPGGGILVMLPILESTLGFNGEMLSLITALYILFDPIITTANILGNGAFAMVMSKIYKALFVKKVPPT